MIKVTDEMIEASKLYLYGTGYILNEEERDTIENAIQSAIEASEEIQELIKQNEWYPIETAPTNKCILVCNKFEKTYIEAFKNERGHWYLTDGIDGTVTFLLDEEYYPYCWRHLPQPPKE